MALYTSAASLGADTTAYTLTGETSGTGYTAGGEILTNVQVLLSGTTAYVTFDNPAWPGSSFVTRGGLIYNSTKADRAIAVLDFGSDKTAGPNFTVQLPAASATTALIRFA
jgi:hypothetical protein